MCFSSGRLPLFFDIHNHFKMTFSVILFPFSPCFVGNPHLLYVSGKEREKRERRREEKEKGRRKNKEERRKKGKRKTKKEKEEEEEEEEEEETPEQPTAGDVFVLEMVLNRETKKMMKASI